MHNGFVFVGRCVRFSEWSLYYSLMPRREKYRVVSQRWGRGEKEWDREGEVGERGAMVMYVEEGVEVMIVAFGGCGDGRGSDSGNGGSGIGWWWW